MSIPVVVVSGFDGAGLSEVARSRVAARFRDGWDVPVRLLKGGGIRSRQDWVGVCWFVDNCYSNEKIVEWGTKVSMRSAAWAAELDYSYSTVESWGILHGSIAGNSIRMVRVIRTVQVWDVRDDEVAMWVKSGVIDPDKEKQDGRVWERWMQTAKKVGTIAASQAAAAGLAADEVDRLASQPGFSPDVFGLLAEGNRT